MFLRIFIEEMKGYVKCGVWKWKGFVGYFMLCEIEIIFMMFLNLFEDYDRFNGY